MCLQMHILSLGAQLFVWMTFYGVAGTLNHLGVETCFVFHACMRRNVWSSECPGMAVCSRSDWGKSALNYTSIRLYIHPPLGLSDSRRHLFALLAFYLSRMALHLLRTAIERVDFYTIHIYTYICILSVSTDSLHLRRSTRVSLYTYSVRSSLSRGRGAGERGRTPGRRKENESITVALSSIKKLTTRS